MIKTIFKNHDFFTLGIPSILIISLFLFTKAKVFQLQQPLFSLAITIDFLLTIPVLYYFLIRKKNINKKSVFTLLAFCIFLARYIIPTENQYFLGLFQKFIWPIFEIGVFTYIVILIKKTIGNYKLSNSQKFDFFEAINHAVNTVFSPKISNIISVEIATFYYGFLSYKTIQLTDNEFSYHKKSGSITLLYFLIGIILLESSIVHLLVAKYSNTAAWILTALSIYAAFQLTGFTKAIKKRPIVFEKKYLQLNYGIFSQTKIDYCKIVEIKPIKNYIPDKNITQLSPLKSFEEPNLLIILSEENPIEKLYGKKINYKALAFFVDEKENFIEKINNLILNK